MDVDFRIVEEFVLLLLAGLVDPDERSVVGLHRFAAGLRLFLLGQEGGGDEREEVAREHGVDLRDVHHLHLPLRSRRQFH